jgi:hypothetical protein
VQLALYANADAVWNARTDRYEPMPAVAKDVAVVMHLPVGRATCELYAVDIAAGWEAAQLCQSVRQWRTRKTLAAPLSASATPVAATPVAAADPDQHNGRKPADEVLAAIGDASSRADLDAIWARADERGLWTDGHTAAAKKRLADLAETPAR